MARLEPSCLDYRVASSFSVLPPEREYLFGSVFYSRRVRLRLERVGDYVCHRKVVWPTDRFVSYDESDECWALPLGYARVEYVPMMHGEMIDLKHVFGLNGPVRSIVADVDVSGWHRRDLKFTADLDVIDPLNLDDIFKPMESRPRQMTGRATVRVGDRPYMGIRELYANGGCITQ